MELMMTARNSARIKGEFNRMCSHGTCMLLFCLLSCSMAGTTAADPDGSNVPAPTMRTDIQQDQLARKLWSSRIIAPDPNDDVTASLALKRLIRQVQSVKFEDKKPAPTFTPPVAPQTPPEPTIVQPAREVEAPAIRPATAAAESSETQPLLPNKTQKVLEGLLQDTGRIHDPLEMAELLFLNGRPTEAAPFYQRALEHTAPGNPATNQDRAWILFQLGNCLRETDLAQAQDTYVKLISEYPDSPWTELAKAHGRLLSWYREARPQELLASRQR
jgi:hypothetical protein